METPIKSVLLNAYKCAILTNCNDTTLDLKINPRNTPLFINISLLPCPPGFLLLGIPPACQCHPILISNGVDCILNDLNSYHKWYSANIWIQAADNYESSAVMFSTHCPYGYCKPMAKQINLNSPDSQCAINRVGILCGGCRKNYLLAIGSSHCINCPNNHYLALTIFFSVAGILFVLVIAGLNLTVTNGTINGLIFLCKYNLGLPKYPVSKWP